MILVAALLMAQVCAFAEPGSLDRSFDVGPATITQINALAVQSDGKILIGGNFTSISGYWRYNLARLGSDGSLDLGFVPFSDRSSGALTSFVLQPDGSVINNWGYYGISKFGADGVADTNYNSNLSVINGLQLSIDLQADGKLLIGGGEYAWPSWGWLYLSRANMDGTRDTNLNVSFDYYPNAPRVYAMSSDAQGRIWVGGQFSKVQSQVRINLARLKADGMLDETFDAGSGPNGPIEFLWVQPDGKAVINGTFTVVRDAPKNRIARLNADGTLDQTFNPAIGGTIRSVVEQTDGKLIAIGSFGVVRLNSDWSLDPTFNSGTGTSDIFRAVALQPDGKILLGGTFTSFNGVSCNHIVRLNGDNPVAPQITTQPTSRVGTSGSSVTFSVGTTGYPAPAYQWQFNGVNIGGATNTVLSLSNATPAQAGEYCVIVTNIAGAVTSVVATLQVMLPPAIVQPPTNQVVLVGDTAVFRAIVSGSPPLSFQWRRNGSSIGAATNSDLILTNVLASQAGNYDLLVNSPWGPVTSSNAILTVLSPAAITSQPLGITLLAGKSTNLTVVATGTPPFSYQWLLNGVPMPNATNSTLYFIGLDLTNAGTYSVQVSNLWGSVTSSNATLTVLSPPIFTSQPIGATMVAGTDFALTASAIGTMPFSYQWKRSNTNLVGETNVILNMPNIQSARAGSYTMVITNTVGATTSAVAVVTVLTSPAIATQPRSQAVVAGSSVSFTVAASGTSPLFYQWQFNGNVMPGATSSALLLASVQPELAGNYSVVVSNSIGVVTSDAGLLTVLAPPVIISQPQSHTMSSGSDATFSVVVTGMMPMQYQWRFQGAAIAGATNRVFLLHNVQPTNGGIYTVLISNEAGSVTSSPAPLAILSGFTGFVVRSLPVEYIPGQKLSVTLQASPAISATTYAVEETPPTGWVVTNISDYGTYDTQARKIKWGLFFDHAARTLSYEVTPPSGPTATNWFFGIASQDGVLTSVGGPDTIGGAPKHPADCNPADWSITIGEVSAYGTAWKLGSNWILGPNPIPIDYVTRSGFIWKNGENYHYVNAATNAPLWWMSNQAGTLKSLASQPNSLGRLSNLVICVMSPSYIPAEALSLQMRVSPDPGVATYAVADHLPSGWTATNFSDDGVFDAANQQIKWGPFLDNMPRNLSCQLVSPSNAVGTASFSGVGSFDGSSVEIAGTRVTRDSIRLVLSGMTPDGQVRLNLHGATGGICNLQVSSNLVDWVPLATVTNTTGNIIHDDTNSVMFPQRFYRAQW